MSAYGTLVNAELYFANRLWVTAWSDATDANKTIALVEASQRIDRLHFLGTRVDDDQDLDFPRYYPTNSDDEPDGTETIPDQIKYACFEIALALLDGINPELELENLAVSSQKFASVNVNYRDYAILEHIAAGIPSALAWNYLRPYLALNNSIRMNRVS